MKRHSNPYLVYEFLMRMKIIRKGRNLHAICQTDKSFLLDWKVEGGSVAMSFSMMWYCVILLTPALVPFGACFKFIDCGQYHVFSYYQFYNIIHFKLRNHIIIIMAKNRACLLIICTTNQLDVSYEYILSHTTIFFNIC